MHHVAPQVTWCIKCDTDMFASDDESTVTKSEKERFLKECVPKAVNDDGSIKPQFACSGQDKKFAEIYTSAF